MEGGDEVDLRGFTLTYTIAAGVGVCLVSLMVVWLEHFRGGFAWSSSPGLQFNWHPLLMTLGMVFIYGNAILIYRVFRTERKRYLKIGHACVNALAFVLGVVGLRAVFEFHNAKGIPNVYSLHSWLGIIVMIIFAEQLLFGLTFFLFPTVRPTLRTRYLSIHTTVGLGGFGLACVTALLGLMEKTFFVLVDPKLPENHQYKALPAEGMLVNMIGMLIVIFGILVLTLVGLRRYRRIPVTEDEMLLTEAIN
ncbi:unnamed protein product [Cyprideis torosa]|uniref:Uncharacterized protein n=1 Tax=Cyprideis torosa TaxID=163714 RepID=A0A7R8W6D6_9CRUS|nr:unnamed protein product [Cyprideis torosa]CAG0881651.1 unnamed protein product [Cyprideis torosa]